MRRPIPPLAALAALLISAAPAAGATVEPPAVQARPALAVTVAEAGPVRPHAKPRLTVRVADRGRRGLSSRSLAVRVRTPTGMRIRRAAGSRWRCDRALRRSVLCRYAGRLPRGRRTTPLSVGISVEERSIGSRLRVSATARARRGAGRVSDVGTAALRVRPVLQVRARALTPQTADLHRARAGDAGIRPHGLLQGEVVGADTARVRLRWRQVGPGPRVRWAPAASRRAAQARFVVPDVERPTRLRFRLTVSDGFTTVRRQVSVTVHDAGSRPRIAQARPRDHRQTLTLGVAVPDQRVPAGRRVHLRAMATGDGPLGFRWRQLGGPDVLKGAHTTGPSLSFTTPRRSGLVRLLVAVQDARGDRRERVVLVRVAAARRARRTARIAAAATGASSIDIGGCSVPTNGAQTTCPSVLKNMSGTLTATKNGGAVDITGSLAATPGGTDELDLDVSGSITDTGAWSLSLTADDDWSPNADGTFALSNVDGTLTASSSGYAVSLTSDTLASYKPFTGTNTKDNVTLTGVSTALGATCATASACATTELAGAITGSANVAPSPASATDVVADAFELPLGRAATSASANKNWRSTARFAGDFVLHDTSVNVAIGDTPSGLDIAVTGQADISSLGLKDKSFAVHMSNDGRLLDISLGDVGFGTGALVVSDHDEDGYTPAGVDDAVDLVDLRPTIAVSFSVPEAAMDLGGLPVSAGGDEITASGEVSLINGSFDLDVEGLKPTGGAKLLFNAGGFKLELGTIGFSVWKEKGGEMQMGMTGQVTFTHPQGTLPMTLGASFVTATGAMSASISLPRGTTWDNALGVQGLTVGALAAAVTREETGWSYGFHGAGTLPDYLTDAMGIASDAPIAITAGFGGANPCFAVEIGEKGGTKRAVNLMNLDVAVSNYAKFVYAPDPDGCVVGTYSYRSGYTIDTDVDVFGEVVAVEGKVVLSGRSIASIAGTAHVGSIDIGGVGIDDTDVTLDLVKLTGQATVQIDGAIRMWGKDAQVSGTFSHKLGKASLDLDGKLASQLVGGVPLGADADLDVAFAGSLKPGDSVASTVDSVSATLDTSLTALGRSFDRSFTLGFSGGQLQSAVTGMDVDLTLGGTGLKGDVGVRWDRGSGFTGTLAGTAKVAGMKLLSVSGKLTDGLSGVELSTGRFSESLDVDLGVIYLRAAFGFSLKLTIGTSTSVSAHGSASVQARDQVTREICKVPVIDAICKEVEKITGWGGWYTLGSADVDFDPPNSVRISIDGHGVSLPMSP